MKHKGFTIVELLIVIAVIAILASITVVSYSFMRGDSMDSKIKAVVKTAGDALSLKDGQTGSRVAGKGYFNVADGMDTLVPQYLKQGYRDGVESNRVPSDDQIFRWYDCADGSGGFVIYASLNNPTSDDIANFQKYRTACGHNDSHAPTSGTHVYNYGQVF
ncbi:hypothetical protein CR969_01250 [Candidatus Saccharibacteria bacterium]|nr:MAG: hypothetical protein CR969_01250 [Candidatus Saccharibacteria bacterium]